MKLPVRQILKSSGLRSLRRKLRSTFCRAWVVSDIKNAFCSLEWSEAHDQKDMNSLWFRWVEVFNALVDKLVGTRLARATSWGRKFDPKVRALCKQASISISWYLLSRKDDGVNVRLLRRWVKDRRKPLLMLGKRASANDLPLLLRLRLRKVILVSGSF